MKHLTSSQKKFLKDLFPGDACLLKPEETLVFGTDAGRMFAPPLAVVRPESQSQVVELLGFAHKEKIPLFPRAAGTNVVGDCVPQGGGIVVSTLLMNKILEVDPKDFVAVTQPGVVTHELQCRVREMGLFYPPDPASVRISTIGGNVSTNAGGMRAVKYGVTRDFVLGLTAVLPGGDVIQTGGRTHKNAVGLDLTGLLVGSEGTLAFITEIILKLLPLPQATGSVMAGYDALETALFAADKVFAAGILPVACEIMDEGTLKCLAEVKKTPWPDKTRAVLLFKLDGGTDALRKDMDRLAHVLKNTDPAYLAEGFGEEREEPLWELRRLVNPASFRLGPDKLSDDVTVPRGRVRDAVSGIRKIQEKLGLPILTFGHLGDGNLHVNIMYDAGAGEKDRALAAKDEILGLALGLGGTLSGEHGVGLAKAPYVDRQIGPRERGLMRSVKQCFDPHGIMNPGKAY